MPGSFGESKLKLASRLKNYFNQRAKLLGMVNVYVGQTTRVPYLLTSSSPDIALKASSALQTVKKLRKFSYKIIRVFGICISGSIVYSPTILHYLLYILV